MRSSSTRTSAEGQRIAEEAEALWRALFDEPPPAGADGLDLLALITARAPLPPDYERLARPRLADRNIVWPRR